MFDSEVKINFDFKGTYISLPERCSHCSTKLSIWKGAESDHTYCCLYCSYVEGECCEGMSESHFKYHYHPMLKIPNSKIIDTLNGLMDFTEIHRKTHLFWKPMIPPEEEQTHECECCKRVMWEVYVDCEQEEVHFWCEVCERDWMGDEIVIKCNADGLLE